MRRRDLLKAAAGAPWLTALAFPERSERGDARPRDLVLIVSDDQSRFDLGCYGNAACTTPHVDRLAAEGARFTAAYTPISLCTPARSCLYTGLYPHKNGAQGFEPVRADVRTWPMWLSGGLATGMVGKLNVRPPEQFPFEILSRGGPLAKEGRSPARYEKLFAEFLAEVGERRFAVVVNVKDPHRPFDEDRFTDEMASPTQHAPGDVWIPPACGTRPRRAPRSPGTTEPCSASTRPSAACCACSTKRAAPVNRW